MALTTRSKFFYGPRLLTTDVYLDFDEGGGEISAILIAKGYSLTLLAEFIGEQMSFYGSQEYTVSINRLTRILTISAPANFDLLTATGSHAGTALWAKLGFSTVADYTGANFYTGNFAAGEEYLPQFFLLDYVSTQQRQEAVEASVNTSGSGKIEVVRYGTQSFMECNISLINDYKWPSDSMIETDVNATAKVIDFLQYLISKDEIEFMPDRDDPNTFERLLLESSTENSKGLGYKLREDLGFGVGYFETGKLIFRKVIE